MIKTEAQRNVCQVTLSTSVSDAKVIVGSKRMHRENVSQVALPIVVSDAKVIAAPRRRNNENILKSHFQ